MNLHQNWSLFLLFRQHGIRKVVVCAEVKVKLEAHHGAVGEGASDVVEGLQVKKHFNVIFVWCGFNQICVTRFSVISTKSL